MSVRLMSAAFSANLPDVELNIKDAEHTVKASTAKFVLLALADHANDEGRGAYPAIDTLAKKTSMSRRTVQRALDALIQLKIIKCVGVSEYGTDNYTIYEHAIYGGDSGTKATDGVTLGQVGGDSGALKSVPESPESSLKPSIKPIQQPSKEKKKITLPTGSDISWQIAAGASKEKLAELGKNEKHAKIILDTYETSMGYNPLDWLKLDTLRKFLLTKTPEEIQAFARWSRREFSTFSPAKARQNPGMVIDLWPQAFTTSVTTRTLPEQKPDTRKMVTPDMIAEARHATRA